MSAWKLSGRLLRALLVSLLWITQVMSEGNETMTNGTDPAPGSMNGSMAMTTVAPGGPGGSGSTTRMMTTLKAAGVELQAVTGALLVPVLLALHRLC